MSDPLPPLELNFPGISLSLAPEEVDISLLAAVHDAFTRVLIHAMAALDPESLPLWLEEMMSVLRREQDACRRR